MRTQTTLRHLAWGVLGLVTQQAYSQASQPDNNGGLGSFLGWNAGANQILDVKNEGNQPIDFYTSDRFRARINPRINYSIGTAPNAPRNGFTLLSGRPSFVKYVKGPFSRLHLVDDVGQDIPLVYAQDIGYRRWMRNGITFTGNSDQAYIGQKYSGGDNTDFVIQWSDNPDGSPWGTDRMKFIFSSPPGARVFPECLCPFRLWRFRASRSSADHVAPCSWPEAEVERALGKQPSAGPVVPASCAGLASFQLL